MPEAYMVVRKNNHLAGDDLDSAPVRDLRCPNDLFATVGVYRWSRISTGRAAIAAWRADEQQAANGLEGLCGSPELP